MRRFPGWVWLLFAVGFAVVASFMAMGWLKRQAAAPPVVKEISTSVVVAKDQVQAASRLEAVMLKTEAWHQEKAPPGSFTNPEQLVGRVTATSLMPGDLVTETKLAPKGTIPGIAALLSPNHRAMTVKVDEASGVAGFLSPGYRVDVVVIVDKGEYDKDPIARLLFQKLKVLGTGQKLETRPGDKPVVVPTVTLEVTPEEGERLALSAQEGRISLILRGQDDQSVVDTPGVDASRLFKRPAKVVQAAVPKAAPPPQRMVDVIRGVEREPVNF